MTPKKRTLRISSILVVGLFLTGLLGALLPPAARGQGLVDGFFRGAGRADVTVSATSERADEFFSGADKTDVPPFYQELTRTTVSLYVAYGLTDNLDVNLNVPYIFASGDGEGPADQLPPQDLNAVQDGGLALKWRPVQAAVGPGALSLVAAGGLAVPLSDYENGAVPDASSERPVLVAIGDRTTTATGALLVQYQFVSGLFTYLQGGYSFKGDTGDDLDVPNAALVKGKVGYGTARYYGDVWIAGQFSTSGTDIGEGPFPTNQVDYTRLGITGSVAVLPSLSANARLFTVIDGRNANDANGVSVGLTYKLSR